MQALLSQLSPEEIESGIIHRTSDRPVEDGTSWTPEEIRELVQVETIPLLVKKMRQSQSMTLAQVAEKVGVSRGRVGQLEMEGANLEVATLAKLAHAMGYTLQVQLVPENGEGEVFSATL